MLRARGYSQEVGRGQRVFPELGPRLTPRNPGSWRISKSSGE